MDITKDITIDITMDITINITMDITIDITIDILYYRYITIDITNQHPWGGTTLQTWGQMIPSQVVASFSVCDVKPEKRGAPLKLLGLWCPPSDVNVVLYTKVRILSWLIKQGNYG